MIQHVASSPLPSPWSEEDAEEACCAEGSFCLGCELCGTCFELDDEPGAPLLAAASAPEERAH
jgi:hypothetical protein